MFYVSTPISTPPEKFKTPLQELAYRTLAELEIEYERVDTDEAVSMDLCRIIDEKLGAQIVKTLLLCDRKQTKFYLYITTGDKPFRSHDFSAALGISRVSFAPSERLEELLGVKIGATTLLSLLLPSAKDVQLVFDSAVLACEYYACSDGTATGFMKMRMQDVIDKLLPHMHREFLEAH
jgi:Ala-tRNA(Pro) deacylase